MQLPTGIVTFFFTDIESSTKIAQRLGRGWDQVLDDHNEIVGSSIASFGGLTVGTEGDSFFAVFPVADDAIRAALDAQRRLQAHKWPPGGAVSVRMGAHTGEGRLRKDFYVGVDIIKAARISDAAHGGQVLVSDATRTLLGPEWAELIELRDLGNHRLKGLDDPEHLIQIVAYDLPSEFPPLRSEGPPSNLPKQDSHFVGRDKETGEVSALLREHRLVTLTGLGGTGKTRLAINVAAAVVHRFDGGVYLVRLDAIDDPYRVGPAIASAIGASQIGDPVEAIVGRVGSRAMLLVIDNFEQVVSAGPVLTRIVDACPRIHILVTSRQLLRLRVEQAYPVQPLGLPKGTDVDAVRESESASLFVRRVATADPSFALTDENAAEIAEIVSRLDGLPLAIELAAARIRLFGVGALRAQLANTMSVLAGGFADAPERHRSLERTIEWSHSLLDPAGQAALRRASVFAGGFSFEAAEELCGSTPVVSVIETLGQLLDNSLITSTTTAGTTRLQMLETIRSFGLARLEEAGETHEVFRSHADYFTGMATRATEDIRRYGGLEQLRAERANLGAAIDWCARNDPDRGLSALFVLAHSHAKIGALDEGRQIARNLLDAGGSSEPRLTGLLGAGAITYWLNEYVAAETYYSEAISLATELGDDDQLADALFGRAFSLVWLDRLDEAEAIGDRAFELFELLDVDRGVRGAMTCRAFVAWLRDDLERATHLFGEVLDMTRRSGDLGEELFIQLALSGILMRLGRDMDAAAVGLYALDRFADVHDEGGLVHALEWLAISATTLTPDQGLVLAGAVDGLKDRRGGFIVVAKLGVGEPRTIAGRALSGEVVDALWFKGRDMDLDDAVRLARDWGDHQGVRPSPIDVHSMSASN